MKRGSGLQVRAYLLPYIASPDNARHSSVSGGYGSYPFCVSFPADTNRSSVSAKEGRDELARWRDAIGRAISDLNFSVTSLSVGGLLAEATVDDDEQSAQHYRDDRELRGKLQNRYDRHDRKRLGQDPSKRSLKAGADSPRRAMCRVREGVTGHREYLREVKPEERREERSRNRLAGRPAEPADADNQISADEPASHDGQVPKGAHGGAGCCCPAVSLPSDEGEDNRPHQSDQERHSHSRTP